jgi:hypothetical protein
MHIQWPLGLQQFDTCQFENFLVTALVFPKKLFENHSQSLTTEELEDLAAQLTQKQQQQVKQEPILRSTEIVAATDRCL